MKLVHLPTHGKLVSRPLPLTEFYLKYSFSGSGLAVGLVVLNILGSKTTFGTGVKLHGGKIREVSQCTFDFVLVVERSDSERSPPKFLTAPSKASGRL